MWLALPDCFLSVVDQPEWTAGDQLVVRARRRVDLEQLLARCQAAADVDDPPPGPILETPDADYRWRINVDRTLLAKVAGAAVQAIDYPNFKATTTDRELHDALLGCWSSMRRLQQPSALPPEPPWLDDDDDGSFFDDLRGSLERYLGGPGAVQPPPHAELAGRERLLEQLDDAADDAFGRPRKDDR